MLNRSYSEVESVEYKTMMYMNIVSRFAKVR